MSSATPRKEVSEPAEQYKHYFIGQFYPPPKNPNHTSYSEIDDFGKEELSRLDVTNLGFQYGHDHDVGIGKFLGQLQTNDGASHVFGYINTSTNVGRYLANELRHGTLKGLSMGHKFDVTVDLENYSLKVDKIPLEISLVSQEDFEGCQVSQFTTTEEIQQMIPILTERVREIVKFQRDEEIIQRYINQEMQNSATPPSVPQPTAAATPTPQATPQAVPQTPSTDMSAKRPRDDSGPSVEPPAKSQKDALLGELSSLSPDTIMKQSQETKDALLKTVLGELAKAKEQASKWEEQEKKQKQEQTAQVNRMREELIKVMQGTITDPVVLKNIDAGLVSHLNKGNSIEEVERQAALMSGIITHDKVRVQETQAYKQKFETLQAEVEKMKQEQSVGSFVKNIGNYSGGYNSEKALAPQQERFKVFENIPQMFQQPPTQQQSLPTPTPTSNNNNNAPSSSYDDEISKAVRSYSNDSNISARGIIIDSKTIDMPKQFRW